MNKLTKIADQHSWKDQPQSQSSGYSAKGKTFKLQNKPVFQIEEFIQVNTPYKICCWTNSLIWKTCPILLLGRLYLFFVVWFGAGVGKGCLFLQRRNRICQFNSICQNGIGQKSGLCIENTNITCVQYKRTLIKWIELKIEASRFFKVWKIATSNCYELHCQVKTAGSQTLSKIIS